MNVLRGFSLKRTGIALGLSAMLLVAACGGDDDDDAEETPDSGSTTEASATATGDASASATEDEAETAEETASATASDADGDNGDSAATGETQTVTDLLGRDVEVPVAPARIVALSPTTVELVYAAGGEVVGRSSTAVFPAEAEAATDVGGAYSPNPETILSLEPDLIIADSVIHADPRVQDVIDTLGVPVIYAGAASVEDVSTALALVGTVLGNEEEAAAVSAEIDQAEADAIAAIGDADVSAIVIIGGRDASDRNIYAAKADSYPGDILARLGITNPAADLPDSGPFPGYATLPPEQLAASDPTVIFALTPAPEPAPRLSTLLPMIPGADQLSAVQNGQVLEVDPKIFLEAPGPRVIEAYAAIADALAPAAE